MYEVRFTNRAERQFEKLDKEIQKRVGSTIENLKFAPKNNSKRLKGIEAHRARVGDYRIIFDIWERELVVLILKLGHRKKIYKN